MIRDVGKPSQGLSFFILRQGKERNFQISKQILSAIFLVTFGVCLVLLVGKSFVAFILIYGLLQFFQSGMASPNVYKGLGRLVTPDSLRVTALSIYSSMGLGLGFMASSLLGGIIFDSHGILLTYTFFGALIALGIIPLVLVTWFIPKNSKTTVLY
ncbi:hypothetical protein [Aneurinibacillus terranovensis]|uniref:hypothetical protein n=1 Tax=Aneurinibacillus terranovensis TaxID=278991 RepID=UPI0004041A6F|nr:hypothetical protein [Aneurinibacillus terranovensis]